MDNERGRDAREAQETVAQILQKGDCEKRAGETLGAKPGRDHPREVKALHFHQPSQMFSRNQTTKLNTCFLKAPYSLTIKRKNILNKTLPRLPILWYPL